MYILHLTLDAGKASRYQKSDEAMAEDEAELLETAAHEASVRTGTRGYPSKRYRHHNPQL